MMKAILLLEDGTKFEGIACGATGTAMGEVIFNTSMTGYQEVLTDPSYYGQIVTMTYPLIGNAGVNLEDYESKEPFVRGFVMRELCKYPNNWRSEGNLEDYLKKHNVIGIEGIDTRALTIILRSKGTMAGVISSDPNFNEEEWIDKLKSYEIHDQVERVTGKERYSVGDQNAKYKVALIDFGAKNNITRMLTERGCYVTIYPTTTPAEEILAAKPDGIMLSNGPGDPMDCQKTIEDIKIWQQSNIPIFGICLGHQLMALANGAKTTKLKYGHRGANHPVYEIKKDRTYITSQNHGYAVVEDSMDPSIAEISHINLNDRTVEGIVYKNTRAFTVQFHPEASAGPMDTSYLFDDFIKMMEV